MTDDASVTDDASAEALPLPRYDTATGDPCPRSVRADGTVDGDGACHSCGMGPGCPLHDPWAENAVD